MCSGKRALDYTLSSSKALFFCAMDDPGKAISILGDVGKVDLKRI